MMTAFAGVLERVTTAFRLGGGVPQSAYDDNMWDGLDRFTNGWFENLLSNNGFPPCQMCERSWKVEPRSPMSAAGADERSSSWLNVSSGTVCRL